jgi:hypothetical protein
MSRDISESSIKTKRQLVTPEVAQSLLDKLPEHQRSLSDKLVSDYAADMTEGRWKENAETIKIDQEGLLLDGQHRLHAVIKSGKSQWMLIALGVDAKAFGTIDVGRKRTPGDIFGIAGWTNSSKAAAITRMLRSCEDSHRTGTVSISKLGPDVYLKYANKHKEEVEIGVAIMSAISKIMSPPAPIAAALAYLHRFAPEEARTFTIMISEGADLKPNSPALVLRNKLVEHEGAGSWIASKRIAEVFVMFGAHLRKLKTGKMVPITESDNSFVTPPIYVEAEACVDAAGKRMSPSAAMEQRARARTKRGKGKAKG